MASPSPSEIAPIRRALLSVSDKAGLVDLARGLQKAGVELLASGGTRTALLEAGLAVMEVSEWTGQAEILDGRVKTLHPKIHAGLLARRDRPEHLQTLADCGYEPIDMVVVNLYPFERTIARPDVTLASAIENIDIGGPSLIRGAAKNQEAVTVVTSPSQYASVLDEIEQFGGTTLNLRRRLAIQVFDLTATYDRLIADYLTRVIDHEDEVTTELPFPRKLTLNFERRANLRYGENPHQEAAFYAEPRTRGPNLATARQVHGKELSYNNLLDLDSALRLLRNFADPFACVLKHNNPCGAAIDADLATAFELAYQGDPVSAFGGIVGCNRIIDAATAEKMVEPNRFLEAILAPGFDPDAREILTTRPTWKKSVRLLDLGEPIGPESLPPQGIDLRRVEGGLLAQSWDAIDQARLHDPEQTRVIGEVGPDPSLWKALRLAWSVCQSVRSNAIVLAQGSQIVGVGAGQMSRLDATRIAIEKAGDRARGSVLASDAFFPFRDGPDLAIAAGVRAIIQPGGSKRDDDTVAACREAGLALVLTGMRHFRH